MLKETKKKPDLEFKPLHWYRYITSLLCMGALASLAIYLKQEYQINSLVAISSLSLGVFVIIGLILTGIKGNKLVSL
jgi:hypothetical protein